MTMNCPQARAMFDDLLDNTLALPSAETLQQHLSGCDACRGALAAEQRFRRMLANQPVPATRPGFAARALQEATLPRSKHQYRSFLAGFGSAVAAVCVLWVGAALYHHGGGEMQRTPAIKLALDAPQTVRLVFDAPEDLPQATVAIYLPDNTELRGYPGQRQLIWTTSLSKGQNLLALPLVSRQVAEGDLVATIRYGNKEKSFRLHLQTQPQQQSKAGSVAA